MLNILLSVLKVIGILIAILLGLLLFLFLIVALGPITYGAAGNYNKKKNFTVKVNWIGIILRYKMIYEEDQGFHWWFRIFGILAASNDEEFIRKKEAKQAQRESRKADKERSESPESFLEKNPETEEKIISVTEEKAVPVEEKTISVEEQMVPAIEDKTVSSVEKKDIPLIEEIARTGGTGKEKVQAVREKPLQRMKKGFALLKKKIRIIIHNIKAIPAKIKKKIMDLQAGMDQLLAWKEFFFGERNKEGWEYAWKHLKKIISHILPVHMQGKIEFGLEDPYMMGQILAILSIFYPVYQDKLTLVPDLENQGFSAEGNLRGRIIPGYVLCRLLIIICSREVRRIIGEGRQLIGGKKL